MDDQTCKADVSPIAVPRVLDVGRMDVVVDGAAHAHERPMENRVLALAEAGRPSASRQQLSFAVGNEHADRFAVVLLGVKHQDPVLPDLGRSDVDVVAITLSGDTSR